MSAIEPSNESSESNPSDAPAPEAIPHSTQKSGGSFWEWFWQSKRAEALRAENAKISEHARSFIDRAQVCLDAAENLGQTKNPEADLLSLVPTAELLKQAATWAALAILDQEGLGETPVESRLEASAWLKVSERLGIANAEELWENWLSQSNAALWAAPPSESRAAELLEVASRLVRGSKRVSSDLDAIWFRRTYRLGVPLVLTVLGIGIVGYTSHRKTVAEETSFPWTISSGQGDGCTSPSQECAEVRYFFHTREEKEPWLEFDLERERSVKSVKIANRNDCAECPDRAVPLVVEISNDRETWNEIGRKEKSFQDWDLKIDQKARWVRFRSLKKTFLHFRQVRIRAE